MYLLRQAITESKWFFKYGLRYELKRQQERFLFWLARKVPARLHYYIFITDGVDTIKDDEIVPEVNYVDLLKRHPGFRN